MKNIVSPKSKNMSFRKIGVILSLIVCFGVAFSFVATPTVRAIFGIDDFLIVMAIGFIAGVVTGILIGEDSDTGSPDAIVTDQMNYVLVWNDFIEEWNNSFIQSNVNMRNFMAMYNLTYLDSVRRAEHEVADFVSYTNWSEVVENMSTLQDFKENITNMLISFLHGYNRLDAEIISYMFDSGSNLDYTHPQLEYYDGASYIWTALTPTNRKSTWGIFPRGYNGSYSVSDEIYITFMYIPDSQYIELRDVNTNTTTNYTTKGVYDLRGKPNEIIGVSKIYGTMPTVYVWGMPTDFDVLSPSLQSYTAYEEYAGENVNQSISFGCPKLIHSITISQSTPEIWNYTIYIDGILAYQDSHMGTGELTVDLGIEATTIDVQTDSSTTIFTTIYANSYLESNYRKGGLKISTNLGGTAYLYEVNDMYTPELYAVKQVGLYSSTDAYVKIYEAMINMSKILWETYHGFGWYNTTDIPSDFIVVPPDVIFDNIGSLTNLPVDIALAIYNAWMYQLIDYYNQNPNATQQYSDENMTMYDLGIQINCTLLHGENTVFTNTVCFISPLLEDIELCSNQSYNLTQGLFIYTPENPHVYYAYTGDNLSITSIKVDNITTDCITLERTTMSAYLLGEYGFNLSFPEDWTPPPAYTIDYTTIAIIGIVIGVIMFVVGSTTQRLKFLKTIGLLVLVVSVIYLLWFYVIEPIMSFLGLL